MKEEGVHPCYGIYDDDDDDDDDDGDATVNVDLSTRPAPRLWGIP